jgi:CTP synthase
LEEAGLIFSGKAPNQPIMQILELPSHPYFFGTQAHPCLTSRPLKPQPMFVGLVAAAMKKRYPKENLPERTDSVRKA